MSADNEDKPKRQRLRVTEETPGKNEMYKVRRRKVVLDPEGASETDRQEFKNQLHASVDMPFEMELALYLEAIEAELDELDLPPPRGWVQVRKDHSWAPVPEGWNVDEIDPDAAYWIEAGASYIKQCTKLYSRPWWLGHLGDLIIRIYDESDPARLLEHTLRFGADRQRFRAQHGHLADIRRGADRSAYLLDNIEKRQKAAAPWRERAASMAAKEWACDSKLSTNRVAMIIYHEFKREADAVRADVTAQWPLIRNEEDEERRERKILSELKARGLLSANGKNIPSDPSIRNYLGSLNLSPRKRS